MGCACKQEYTINELRSKLALADKNNGTLLAAIREVKNTIEFLVNNLNAQLAEVQRIVTKLAERDALRGTARRKVIKR